MKRKTLILSAVAGLGLISITTMAIASDHYDDDDDRGGRGWCHKSKMMNKHHGGMGMGMGLMGGKHMGQFMKDGKFDMQLTPERVKEIMEGRIAMMGNPNLKVGEILTDDDGNIVAKLVTVENSLVETFKIDPKTGAHSPLR